MLWTSPRLDVLSVQKFYKYDYREMYNGAESPTQDFFNNQVYRGSKIKDYCEDFIDFKKEKTVFEIGCGAGGILVDFKKSGCTVKGYDFGISYIEYGRKQGLDINLGDAKVLQREEGFADLIILSHVLEHFSDPFKEIELIKSLIKDNGYLYIEVPGVLDTYRAYGDFLKSIQNAHFYYYNEI